MAPDTIIGRSAELAAVTRFLEDDAPGTRGLVIEGEAGVGKTTLWCEAVRLAAARGRVLTARAAEIEARLSFTVLGDVLGPVLDESVLEQLGAGQRGALERALLLTQSGRADQRAVSLAVLGVLDTLAKREPLTIAIDDIQWVDRPSARALSFALRRLAGPDTVRIVAARRLEPGSDDPLDLALALGGSRERLTVAPPDAETLGRILRTTLERAFPPPLVTRIHEQTGGNPFFAIEVGRALEAESASVAPGGPLPVPRELDDLLRRRVSRLPADGRDAALVIAASPTPTRETIIAAGVASTGIEDTVAAEIVRSEYGGLRFTHPLLASTVYAHATDAERQDAHARLANVASDSEERARHLALSCDGPDPDVAQALCEAGEQARNRGAPHAAADLYILAASLSTGATEQAARRRAATNLFDAGDAEGARSLLEELLEDLEPGTTRASVLFTLSFMSWYDMARVVDLLTEALDLADDPDLRTRVLADMAWSEFQLCRPEKAADLARAALALAESLSDPFPTRHSLSALASAEAIRGRPARHLLERAVTLELDWVPGEATSPSLVYGRLELWAGELRAARSRLERMLQQFVDQGRDAGTSEIVALLAEVELRAGRWELAARHASRALEIAVDSGRGNETVGIVVTKTAIAGLCGDIDAARRDGLEALARSEQNGDPWNEVASRSALGLLELSCGDPAAAAGWLKPAVAICEQMGLREPGVFPFVPDLVEALLAVGEREEAERLAEALERQGRALDRPLALATSARCKGLIAGARGDLAAAEEHVGRALVEHSRTEHPFELARTLLLAGEVQRRMKRKRPARELLERARASFDALGAPLWSARVDAELGRIGGRPPSPDGLTPTEAEVARLVARGLTNREVARALFISPHTVDANLRRVYRKLDVRSRTELAHKL